MVEFCFAFFYPAFILLLSRSMVWFFNRNNTFSSSHLANNERTVSLLVVHCGLLSTLLQTIKIRQHWETAAIFNMIVSACDSLSSSIFNLKIKFYARFSRSVLSSHSLSSFHWCSVEWISFWPIITLACEKRATETNCSKLLNKEFSRINVIRFFFYLYLAILRNDFLKHLSSMSCPHYLHRSWFFIRFERIENTNAQPK